VQVVDPTLHAMGRLLAICPYVAKLLAVVTLRKNIMDFVRLNLDCNITKT
jgi:hypothetical protein